MKYIELQTPLAKAECEKRLRKLLHDPLENYHHVYGEASGPTFWIEHKKNIACKNTFKTRLCGDVVERQGKTIICCRIGLLPFLFAMTVCFYICLPLAGAGAWLISGKPPLVLLPPLVMITFILGLGQLIAKDEGSALLRFVCANLAASPRELDTATKLPA